MRSALLRAVPRLTILQRCGHPSRPERVRPQLDPHHIPSAGQFTIQGMPNLSTHMPKPLAQNVLLNGIVTVPPPASALNLRSASATSVNVSEMEKPWGFCTCS